MTRRVFDDSNIDAVVVATPNQWHCLTGIWAMANDVYVESRYASLSGKVNSCLMLPESIKK